MAAIVRAEDTNAATGADARSGAGIGPAGTTSGAGAGRLF